MILSLGAAAALGHAFLVALATVLVNIASRYDGPVTLMFYTNIVSVTLIAIPTIFVWQTPNMTELAMLVAMGVLATASHNCFIRAFAMGEASVIAPVDYSRLIFAALAGWLVFASVPDIYTIIGASIIVGSSFYIVRREAGLQKGEGEKAPPAPAALSAEMGLARRPMTEYGLPLCGGHFVGEKLCNWIQTLPPLLLAARQVWVRRQCVLAR